MWSFQKQTNTKFFSVEVSFKFDVFFLLPRIVWVQVFSSEAYLVCLNVAHNATVVAGRYGTMPYMSSEMAASAGHSFSTFELLLENENEKH